MKTIIFYLVLTNLISAMAQMAPPPQVVPSGLDGLRVGPDVFPLEKGVLKPFKSEACSLSPSSISGTKVSWASCCVRHDLAYWLGGTEQDRLTADEALKSCIGQKANAALAKIYFSGVRIGGPFGSGAAFRWGYGWNYIRPYSPLTDYELSQAQALYGKKLEGLAQATDLKTISSNSKTKVFDQSLRPPQKGELQIYDFLKATLRGSTFILSATFVDVSFDLRQFRLVLESCPQAPIVFDLDRSSLEIKRILDEPSCLSKVGEKGEGSPHTLAF